MAKKSIYEMSRENLADMSVKELKAYIRAASQKVSSDKRSRYKAVSSSAKYIAESIGERRTKNKVTGHYRSQIILGFDGMTKKDLLQRARMLQGHFKIDVYSRNAREHINKVTEESLESFEKNTGVSLTKEEFADFKVMIGGIKDLIEKFGSDNIAKMYDEINMKGGKSGRLNLGAILREVYDHVPEGSRKSDLLDEAYTYINMLYAEAY